MGDTLPQFLLPSATWLMLAGFSGSRSSGGDDPRDESIRPPAPWLRGVMFSHKGPFSLQSSSCGARQRRRHRRRVVLASRGLASSDTWAPQRVGHSLSDVGAGRGFAAWSCLSSSGRVGREAQGEPAFLSQGLTSEQLPVCVLCCPPSNARPPWSRPEHLRVPTCAPGFFSDEQKGIHSPD